MNNAKTTMEKVAKQNLEKALPRDQVRSQACSHQYGRGASRKLRGEGNKPAGAKALAVREREGRIPQNMMQAIHIILRIGERAVAMLPQACQLCRTPRSTYYVALLWSRHTDIHSDQKATRTVLSIKLLLRGGIGIINQNPQWTQKNRYPPAFTPYLVMITIQYVRPK